MSVRDDLEEALLACWNVDDLAVYADHLLADGDPRGELIALDLQPAPASPEWATRRQAALRAWLGSDLAARAHAAVRFGFVQDLDDGKGAAAAIAGPLLETRRQISFVGHIHTLSRLACLWLERLPLVAGTRRVIADYLGVLHDLRRGPRAHAEEGVSANLDRARGQIAALHEAGLDPRRGGEETVWQTGWTDMRDGAYRELLRAAIGTRMTFVVR